MTLPLFFIVGGLAVLLAGGIWVGISLLSLGLLSLELFRDLKLHSFLAGDIWSSGTAQELVTLPMFVLMGEILFHTRISQNLFSGLAPFVRRLPGALLHVNVLGCTLFAAVSGSSAATTTTVGRITLRELDRRGYDKRLAMGSLAGAGTIGFLIPPSIPLIVYGVLADVSILQLFIAGIVPGLLLGLLFMGWIGVRSSLSSNIVPKDPPTTLQEKWRALRKLLPITLLILLIVVSMYGGYASITEAAAVGVLGALLLAIWDGGFSLKMLWGSLLGTVKTCSMIGLIIVGALFLSKAMARLAIPSDVASAIAALELEPWMFLVLLTLFYLLLGCVMDGLSTIVMTLPVTLPLVINAGFDPLWFGIYLVITIEMAQITPPIGFNLFVIRSLTGETTGRIALASAPFCALMLVAVLAVSLFPALVTWLPGQMN
ncbi:TRAP transporter large permease subunit (plasmid) [Sulfitobacter sp. LCG007]